MKAILSKPGITGLAVIAAITVALMSVYIERTGPEPVQYGNLCGPAAQDPCYKPALKGGFPVAYLFDAPGISVERQLAFFEDKLHLDAFIADVVVYFTVFMAVAWVILRRRSAVESDAE